MENQSRFGEDTTKTKSVPGLMKHVAETQQQQQQQQQHSSV